MKQKEGKAKKPAVESGNGKIRTEDERENGKNEVLFALVLQEMRYYPVLSGRRSIKQ